MKDIVQEHMEALEQIQDDYLQERIEIEEMHEKIEKEVHKFRTLYRRRKQHL